MIRVHFIKRHDNVHSINSQSSFITFINWQNLWCFVFSLLFLEFCGGNTCRWTNQMNRPLALRCHVTNASFKQWVGILLLPKIDRARKNYGTPEIWEEAHSREIINIYGTLIFQQSSMICIGRHVGGHTLALQHGSQNYFYLISC